MRVNLPHKCLFFFPSMRTTELTKTCIPAINAFLRGHSSDEKSNKMLKANKIDMKS